MTLVSPGIEVQVIDESFYLPTSPGTVPLIIVVSKENKTNAAGTGVATGTLKANAGKAYLLTSQRDLGNIFGTLGQMVKNKMKYILEPMTKPFSDAKPDLSKGDDIIIKVSQSLIQDPNNLLFFISFHDKLF